MRYLTARQVVLRRRRLSSHKGENGRVLVVGGSVEYVGAVLLAALAAYRSGVDWVQVAAPEKVAWAISAFSPDIVTTKMKGEYFTAANAERIAALSQKFDVVVIGSGLGRRATTRKFAAAVVKKVRGLKVVDADAITAIRLQDVQNAVITPHRKEFERLLKNSGFSEQNYKKHLGSNVLLLKGKVDKIVAAKKTAYNKTGNPGMTVAGTGDVLAGLAAGLLAQEKDRWKAACAAAYVNGKAGDELCREKEYGFLASELLERIPQRVRGLRHG